MFLGECQQCLGIQERGAGDAKGHPCSMRLLSLPRSRKRWRSLSSSCSLTSRNICEMSAERAIWCIQKRLITVVSNGYREGPCSNNSFRETRMVEAADPSNTTLSLVVVDDSFLTPVTLPLHGWTSHNL